MRMTLLSSEVDARVGGQPRLVFDHGGAEPAAFFGTYVEVRPSRASRGPMRKLARAAVTTVAFEEHGGKTLVVLRESYPSRKRSTLPAPEQPMQSARRSISWTSFSSPWVRARDIKRDVDHSRFVRSSRHTGPGLSGPRYVVLSVRHECVGAVQRIAITCGD